MHGVHKIPRGLVHFSPATPPPPKKNIYPDGRLSGGARRERADGRAEEFAQGERATALAALPRYRTTALRKL
jgi:hypothetical protein